MYNTHSNDTNVANQSPSFGGVREGLWIILLFLLSFPVSAQQRFFNLTAEDVRVDSISPYFTYSVPLGENYSDSIYTVSIEYPEFIDMNKTDIATYKSLRTEELPEMPVIYSNVVVERKRGILEISFIPLVVREGKFKKLVSFMLDVKSRPAGNPELRAKARTGSGQTARYAQHSVLADGKWAKIRVPATGVYQLTDALIRRAGFSDINKVRIYGYGGALQNETLVAEELIASDDLKEVATCTVNGKRLFRAQGPVGWESAASTTRIRNPYSDYGYYFITQQDGEPLTTDSISFINSFYPSYDDYHTLYETDNYAWYEGGRNLFEKVPINSGNSKTYTIETPGKDTTGKIYVAITAGGASEVQVEVNDSVVGTLRTGSMGEYDYAKTDNETYTVYNMAALNNIKLTVVSGGPVRLDYISATFATPRELPDLGTATFSAPEYVYNITNQDLHGDGHYQMVIVIPASGKLREQAERLKAFHEEHDGMRVRLVPADELYNEFSSGTPDVNAYRRYMKMLYDRAETEADMPRYLLLFGDCAWDNRMISEAWANYSPDDFLLCYESENSYNKVDCYINDGFFCSLDDGEGGDPEKKDKHDIAVGRFPVRNADEAKIIVDKTISYIKNENAGAWQNIVMVMGDDGNSNTHMEQANSAAQIIESLNPAIQVKRVMWDAYRRESSSTGYSYPDVTDVIRQQQSSGALVMSYSGHGAANSISHEYVLRLTDFKSFTNSRLPLWITASCDIMPYDGQTENIGEQALLNSKGGAVAFFGTTRTVYTNYNRQIHDAYIKALFTKVDGKYVSIGEAQRLAKNRMITPVIRPNGSSVMPDDTKNKLSYALLGDPALVLNIPVLSVVVDSINGKAATAEAASTLKAGTTATVKGHIERGSVKDDTFNGTLTSTVRDSEELVTCRLNDTSDKGADKAFTYYDRTKVLFNGNDSVRAGEFSFSFAVPMDINYSDAAGMINMYAVDSSTKATANGYNDKIIVGGSDTAENDSIGPSIYCYLNSPSFVNGGNVNTTPYFVARINDKDGLNTTGNGIGHNLELTIDGDTSKKYILNDNFEYDFGTYTSGSTYYNIPELAPGMHKLKFRAWDILNNPSTAELSFNVVKGLEPSLFSVDVTENPVRTSTTFIINHDRIGCDMNVEVEVFDTSGRIIWHHKENGVPTTAAYTVDWDLRTDNGQILRTGVYIYRVRISCQGSPETSKSKKLIVINNK